PTESILARAPGKVLGPCRSLWCILAFGLMLGLTVPPALAHQQSDSYLGIHVDDAGVNGRWDVALHDLDRVLHLDTNDDGQVTWEEIRLQRERITKYILGKLKVVVDGVPGRLRLEQLEFDEHVDGYYAVLRF